MNLLKKFMIFSAAGAAISGFDASAQTAPTTPLTMEERETLSLYHAQNQCMSENEALIIVQQNQYNRLLQIRETSIAAQAEKIAKQRNDASMHIIMGGALSEGLTQEDATALVDEARINDEIFLREQLEEYVPMPTAPQSLDAYCAEELNIDTANFGRRLRNLTARHGEAILNTPAGP